jgi:hypothetical protein
LQHKSRFQSGQTTEHPGSTLQPLYNPFDNLSYGIPGLAERELSGNNAGHTVSQQEFTFHEILPSVFPHAAVLRSLHVAAFHSINRSR